MNVLFLQVLYQKHIPGIPDQYLQRIIRVNISLIIEMAGLHLMALLM